MSNWEISEPESSFEEIEKLGYYDPFEARSHGRYPIQMPFVNPFDMSVPDYPNEPAGEDGPLDYSPVIRSALGQGIGVELIPLAAAAAVVLYLMFKK